ncbi:MAG: YraN family protein [Acidobacteriales bacterium]|nr:YraN family protein [Terriglobales bacterium]
MATGSLTHITVRALDWIADQIFPAPSDRAHHKVGRRGEEDAYFYLRHLGYVMVARNFRSARRRGEIDLIGWNENVLCFIEVKTRTTRDVKPAEAAVDQDKRRVLNGIAREFLRLLPAACKWRFDVVSVYYEGQSRKPQFELFVNAFPAT